MCSAQDSINSTTEDRQVTMPPRNLICLSVDALQAGMLGPYGNAWIRTPAVNRLASQSLVFDQAFACEPSLDAVLRQSWPAEIFAGRRATLLTDDRAAESHVATSVFADKHYCEPGNVATAAAIEDTEIGMLLGQAAELIREAAEPFALWIHSRGMTGLWDAPYEFREQYADEEDPPPPDFVKPPERLLARDYDPDELLGIQQAYVGQTSAFDACLGALVAALDDSAFAQDTLLVLLGTRGFPLGEHLRVGFCDAALYNELTHVPLIVRSADRVRALERSQSLVTQADLLALLQGKPLPSRDHLRFHSPHNCAIRTPAWYLRESNGREHPHHELYAKPGDRYEVNNVADRCPEIVAQLAEVLATSPGEITQPLSEALVAALD